MPIEWQRPREDHLGRLQIAGGVVRKLGFISEHPGVPVACHVTALWPPQPPCGVAGWACGVDVCGDDLVDAAGTARDIYAPESNVVGLVSEAINYGGGRNVRALRSAGPKGERAHFNCADSGSINHHFGEGSERLGFRKR